LRVGSVPHDELVAWLVDRERLPADQADVLARIAGGLPGRAIGLSRTPELVAWRRRTQDQLLQLLGRGRADRFASVRELLEEAGRLGGSPEAEAADPADGEPQRPVAAEQRAAAMVIVDVWLGLARDLLMTAAGREDLAPAARLIPDLPGAARQMPTAALLAFIELLERIREGLRQSAAPRLALEVAMLAWPTTGAEAPPGVARP
jgi:hypothetical protein